jgi:transcriptional regulator with XRE-family HTH domain
MIAYLRLMFHVVKRRGRTRIRRMELHEHLRQAREDAGLSVKAVAAELGLTRVQVWRMEKDAGFVSVERLRKLANLYGRPIQVFFDDTIEIDDHVSYQLVGMAVEAVEMVASGMSVRPTPAAIRSAVIAVVRAQHKRWAEDTKRRFDPKEFTALIEQHFDQDQSNT